MPNIEFIVWGVAPGDPNERLLLSEQAKLTSRASAEKAIIKLQQLGCTKCRIQEFRHGDPCWDVSKMFNK